VRSARQRAWQVALAGLRTVWLVVRLAVVIFAAPLGTAVPLGVTAIVFDAHQWALRGRQHRSAMYLARQNPSAT
jgi:uncharacterized membrane protein